MTTRREGAPLRVLASWIARAEKRDAEAVAMMREAADAEDSLEKLPVTPGPIVPAREQLGALLLEQGRAELAAKEFQAVLVAAPARRGAMTGLARARQLAVLLRPSLSL